LTDPAFDPAACEYVSLATFRRNGAQVATPVWIGGAADHYFVFSEGRAGKVKRLRNNPAIRLAPCDFRGGLLGDWREGRARLVDDATTLAAAYHALREKYGWKMQIGDALSKLSRRYDRRAMIEITLE
jgi:PPOX class probable F420-dependent enzyme